MRSTNSSIFPDNYGITKSEDIWRLKKEEAEDNCKFNKGGNWNLLVVAK